MTNFRGCSKIQMGPRDPEIREVTLEIERIKESAEAKNDLLDDSRKSVTFVGMICN